MRRLGLKLVVGAFAATALAAPALADDTQAPAPDKSGFTLFNPTPDADLRSLCADRPTKATGACTVDAGHWQVESDIYNITTDTSGGLTTRTELLANPTLKLGLTNTLDVEVNIAPYELVTAHDSVARLTTRARGVGDLFLRAKLNLIGDDGGQVAIAVEPYVKVPTAPLSIGNGQVEEGVLAPVTLNLPANWQLTVDPELDILANSAGAGRHVNLSMPISLSYPLTKELTGSAEVWGDVNFDPAGQVTQGSFDLALAWIPAKAPTLQLDGGVNLGLNKATPGLQAYAGISKRF
jgi:hypothetical protein